MDSDRRSKFVTPDDEPLEIDRSRASGPNLLAGRSQRIAAATSPADAEAEVEALAAELAKEAALSPSQSRLVIRSIAHFTLQNPLLWSAIARLALRDTDDA